MRLHVEGRLNLEGRIVSNGASGTASSGGGSGGSIWITATELVGTGGIEAKGGGTGIGVGGSGGGGRIAVGTASDVSGLTITASGFAAGSLTLNSAAGTIRLYNDPLRTGTVIVDNNDIPDNSNARTVLPNETIYDRLIVRRSGKVGSAATRINAPPLWALLRITEDCVIDEHSAIDASGRGYRGGSGPGVGLTNSSGGGYGGRGGSANQSGRTYGSPISPVDHGSGGQGGGGAGGGAVRLIIDGTLTLDGVIQSNGMNAQSGSGGGSGGSVWVTASSVRGEGHIRANGGNGGSGATGGGGGGRIAVDACLFDLPTNRVSTSGGNGTYQGCPGTISLRHSGISTLAVSSNGPASAHPMGAGNNSQQVIFANQPPPPTDSNGWTTVRRQRDGSISASYPNCTLSQADGATYLSTLTPIFGVDEVTYDNCNSSYLRFVFDLPDEFSEPTLIGTANADDMAVVWLNGNRISAPADLSLWNTDYSLGCVPAVTWATGNNIFTGDPSYFRTGANELVFSLLGNLSVEPTGVEFMSYVQYRTPQNTGSPLVITEEPADAVACAGGSSAFLATATGLGTLAYAWEIRWPGPSENWIALHDGETPGLGFVAGSSTNEIALSGLDGSASRALLRVRVTDLCGERASRQSLLLVCTCGECSADFNFDGGIDGADIDLFFSDWESDVPCADVNRDGGIDGGDIEAFFAAWESGAC